MGGGDSADSSGLFRSDIASTTEFFSAIAAVFRTHEVMSQKHADLVTRVLRESAVHASRAVPGESLIFRLRALCPEFFQLLDSRFRRDLWFSGYVRYTLTRASQETVSSLAFFASEIADKTSLVLNRTLPSYFVGRQGHQVFVASSFLELAEMVSRAAQYLEDECVRLRYMHRHSMYSLTAQDDGIDTDLSEALGLRLIEHTHVCFHFEAVAVRNIGRLLSDTCDYISVLYEQIHPEKSRARFHILVQNLLADCRRVTNASWPASDDLAHLEARRFSTVGEIAGLNQNLGFLREELVSLARVIATAAPTLPTGVEITDDRARRVAFTLLKDGKSSDEANSALSSLVAYCHSRQTAPSALIAGEIETIHPALSSAIVETIARGVTPASTGGLDESVALALTMRKTDVSNRIRSVLGMTQRLISHMATIAVLIVGGAIGAGILPGCGLKTDPKSDVSDFRPDLPLSKQPSADWGPAPSPAPAGNVSEEPAPAVPAPPAANGKVPAAGGEPAPPGQSAPARTGAPETTKESSP